MNVDGIDWSARRGGCPECGRDGERGWRGTLGIGPHRAHGRIVAHCFRCGFVAEPDRGTLQAGEAPPAHQRQQQHETLSDFGSELWSACRPLAGEARAYLEARRCVIPPADGHLRWHPALRHPPSGLQLPALVALVTDATTGEPISLHRTWVAADGSKPLEPARMLLAGHRKAGGVIRLWPDDLVTHGLGVTEGIETALSLAHAIKPVWACVDAGNLATLPVLGGVECLTVAADHDASGAGEAAARRLADRWARAGREVYVVLPPTTGDDLNDVARAA
jgi:putative DNA primase/helicase